MESLNRWQNAPEQALAAVFEWNDRTGAFRCSEACQNYVLSQSDCRSVAQNRWSHEAVHPDDLPTLQEFFAVQGAAERACILRLKMTDGTYRWSCISCRKAFDADGNPGGMVGRIADIHDEMENSLVMNERACMLPSGCAELLAETQQHQEQMLLMLNNVPGGIGIFEVKDNKIVHLYLNDAFYRMLRDTRENRRQYTGENYWKAVHPEDAPAFRKAFSGFLHGERTVEATYRVKGGDGEWVWLRLNGNLCAAGARQIIYCSFFDVDEQMKTELALKREQMILKLAMQTAKMSSWEYDVREKRIYQAKESRAQHGYAGTVENVPESLIQDGFVYPDCVEEYRRLFTPAADENDIKRADIRVKTKDRQGYWWERIILTPFFDAKGVHIRSIGTTIDVTEQKSAELKYRRKMQEMSAANSPDLIAKGLYNLMKNRMESYQELTENAVSEARVASYDDGRRETSRRFFREEEAQAFLAMFDRPKLLQDFNKGETECAIEYQRNIMVPRNRTI